ncbi:MAG: R3H domain-containing nucleic acid-binding protein [Patescibacteria group bacterium]
MNQLQDSIKKIIESMGFEDFSVNFDADSSRFSIFINDDLISEKNLPEIVDNLDYLIKLIAQKNNIENVFIDVNNYRRKREGLIVELAKAAARKVLAEKKEISLPAMNAYERRLIHLELAGHPDVKTESVGEGRSRYIVVKIIS